MTTTRDLAAAPATRVRVLDPDELRSAHRLFATALHVPPASDERWERIRDSYAPGRVLGVDDPAGALAGTATSWCAPLTVPGGARVPMAAVTRVGVRADRTRRGLLTALMHAQLRDAADRGEVAATLRASEARIYGRFGYGVATRGRRLRLARGARFGPDAPRGGELRLVDAETARTLLPVLFDAMTPGPGAIGRTPGWWDLQVDRGAEKAGGIVVHTRPGGRPGTPGDDDGFAVWTVRDQGAGFGENLLEVADLHAADAVATAGLWRFLRGIDLVRDVEAGLRPLDEPLELLLDDPRSCATTGIGDETWLRLLDVPAALTARAWGDGEPVRIRVHDTLFAANDRVHVVGAEGPAATARTDRPADLECDVAALAMAYLGDRRPSELVAAGRWTAHDPAAVARADALFGLPGARAPWCGTFF